MRMGGRPAAGGGGAWTMAAKLLGSNNERRL
jgi:hypothetical protein